MKSFAVFAWTTGLWVAFALIGYGVALKQYSSEGAKPVHINDVGPTEGRLVSVRKFGSRLFGFHFRVEGFPQTFHVPAEFVKDEAAWEELEWSLAVGVPVRFKASLEDRVIIQMTVNFRTPREAQVVDFDHVARTRPLMGTLLSKKGSGFILVGTGVFLFAVYALAWDRRRRTVKRLAR